MNGFLSNLTARSFDSAGATALVSPRLPSLFEPAHPKWGDLPELPAGSVPGEETGDKSPESNRWADGEQPMQASHHLQRGNGPHWPSIRPMKDSEWAARHPAGQSAAAADKEPAGGNSVYETRVQHASRANTQQLKAPEVAARPMPMPGPDRQSDKAQEELPIWSERAPRRIAAAENEVEDTEIGDRIKQMAASIMQAGDEGSEKRMNAAERPAIHPAVPAAPPWEERKFNTPAAKPEPTIQVTIGRIEVRAVMPGKPEKRKATSGAMSLDDYLAGRREGHP